MGNVGRDPASGRYHHRVVVGGGVSAREDEKLRSERGEFYVEDGWNFWYVVGLYIPPNAQPVVRSLEQSLTHYPA